MATQNYQGTSLLRKATNRNLGYTTHEYIVNVPLESPGDDVHWYGQESVPLPFVDIRNFIPEIEAVVLFVTTTTGPQPPDQYRFYAYHKVPYSEVNLEGSAGDFGKIKRSATVNLNFALEDSFKEDENPVFFSQPTFTCFYYERSGNPVTSATFHVKIKSADAEVRTS